MNILYALHRSGRPRFSRWGTWCYSAVLGGWFVAQIAVAENDSNRLTRYLGHRSPLSQIEAALGITRSESRQFSRLTGVRQHTPLAALGNRALPSLSRLIGGARWNGTGQRLFGVQGGINRSFNGLSTRARSSDLFGVSRGMRGGRDFGALFVRFGSSSNDYFPGQPRPHLNRLFGPGFGGSNRVLPPQRWNPAAMYGVQSARNGDRLYGFSRSGVARRNLSGVRVGRTPGAILDRGGLGRRHGVSGRRLFGL